MAAKLSRLLVTAAAGAFGVTIGSCLVSENDNIINSSGPVRFGRAALTMARIFADYKFTIYYNTLPEDKAEKDLIWSQVHRRSALKLLDLCSRNKGVFVKVGQHIGAMDYLLPPEYTETLRILHNQAPSSSSADVHRVLKEDLKLEMGDIFLEFADQPIGTASLAQVYKATLKQTGEIVAVKVQHLNVRAHSYVDIKTMEILVHLAAWMFPDFKLLWLAEEMKKNLPQELDFLREGRNGEKMSELMKNYKWLKIPKVYWDLSSHRVLVMEFCEGGLVNDLQYMEHHNISTREIGTKLGNLFSEMIFIHGNLHCDPHPGNILVRKNKDGNMELVLLDHGLYAMLPDDLRYNYSKLWLSILGSDVDGIKAASKALGVENLYGIFTAMITARSWESISSPEGIAKKKLTTRETEEIKKKISEYIVQISEVLDRIPRPMIMIMKTNDLLRGVEHALRTQKTMISFTTMSKYCVRSVYDEQIKHCTTEFCRFKLSVMKHWTIMKIRVYELYLWVNYVVHYSVGYRDDEWL